MPGVVICQTIYVDSEEELQEIVDRITNKSTEDKIQLIRNNLNRTKIEIERYENQQNLKKLYGEDLIKHNFSINTLSDVQLR